MNRTDLTLTISGLSIGPESLDDAADIYKYMGLDPEITRYTGWNPYQTLQATKEKIQRDISSEDGSYSWVIRKDGAFVGTIGAYDYQPDERSIEIGYSIAREFWGNGYAGAVAKTVVEFLLREPQIQEIRAWSHRNNLASIRVLLGAGLKETGKDGEQITFVARKTNKMTEGHSS